MRRRRVYAKIFVSLDGSNLSERILPCAGVMAEEFHIPVELLGSGGDRWLLGSVAEKVIQLSRDPVLVIRPE